MTTQAHESILTTGEFATLRIWRDEEPVADAPMESRPYETLGYVISGAMDLVIEGKTVSLSAGDSYNVPRGKAHRYVITQKLTAVEAIAEPK